MGRNFEFRLVRNLGVRYRIYNSMPAYTCMLSHWGFVIIYYLRSAASLISVLDYYGCFVDYARVTHFQRRSSRDAHAGDSEIRRFFARCRRHFDIICFSIYTGIIEYSWFCRLREHNDNNLWSFHISLRRNDELCRSRRFSHRSICHLNYIYNATRRRCYITICIDTGGFSIYSFIRAEYYRDAIAIAADCIIICIYSLLYANYSIRFLFRTGRYFYIYYSFMYLSPLVYADLLTSLLADALLSSSLSSWYLILRRVASPLFRFRADGRWR